MEKINLYDRYYVNITIDILDAEQFNRLALLLAENNFSFSVDTYDRQEKEIKSFGGLANSDLLEINLGQKRID